MNSTRFSSLLLGLTALLFACSSPQDGADSAAVASASEATTAESSLAVAAPDAYSDEELTEEIVEEVIVDDLTVAEVSAPAAPTAVLGAEAPAAFLASATLPAPAGLAAMLPADTVLYVSIPDVAAMRASIAGSTLGQIYWHEDMQAFLAGGLAMLGEGWTMMRGMAGGMGIPEEATHWDALKSVEVGFAMRGQEGLENPFDAEPEIYLLARIELQQGLAGQLMDRMSPMLEAQGMLPLETANGTAMEMRPPGTPEDGPALIELRTEGDAVYFEMTMGTRGKGVLAASPEFQAARTRVDADAAAVFAYADFNGVWDTVMAGLAHEEPEVAALLHYVMDPIMTPMQSIAMASGWDGGVSFTNFSIDLAEDAGPLWQSGPADLALLDYVPADATSFSVGDFSSANAWAAHFLGALDMLGGMDMGEGATFAQMTEAELPEAHAWLFGAERPELDAAMASFGTRTFSYGVTAGLASENVMFTEVSDAAALSGALEKLMPRLREALQLADAPIQLDLKRVRQRVEGPDGQMQTVAGPAYYSLNLGASMPQELSMIGLNFQPTIGVTADGWMVFSMARGPVRNALSNGVQKPDESLRTNAEVQAFLARAGSGASSVSWSDPRPPMESMLGMALGLAPMAAQAVADTGLPFDLNAMPGVDVFIAPMRPTETLTRMEGGDLVAQMRGSFGFADLFTICGAVVGAAPVGVMSMTVDQGIPLESADGEPELEEF